MRKGMTESEAGRLGAEKSKATSEKMKRERIEKYLSNPKLCKFCNNVIPYEKRINDFCGSSCSCSFTNKGVRRHGKPPSNCLKCGKKTASHKAVYCSHKCHRDYQWDMNKLKMEKDGEFTSLKTTGEVERRMVKRYLVERDGYKCSICSITEWTGDKVPLIVDHIDGNYLNSKIENFRLCCPNCEAKLPTSRGKNIGKGRIYRREYRKMLQKRIEERERLDLSR